MHSKRKLESAQQIPYSKRNQINIDTSPIFKEQYLLKGLNKAILALLNHSDTDLALMEAFQVISAITGSNAFFLCERIESQEQMDLYAALQRHKESWKDISTESWAFTFKNALENECCSELKRGGLFVKSLYDFNEEIQAVFCQGNVNSCLVSPIIVDNQMWGGLILASEKEAAAWDQEEINIIEPFAYSLGNFLARKKSENDLKTQRDYLHKIIDLNPSFIFARNRKGEFTLANQSLAKAYGTTVENLLARKDTDFLSNKTELNRIMEEDLEVMDSQTARFVPLQEIVDLKGNKRILQIIKSPILGEDGSSDELLGIAMDITESHLASEQIEKAEEALKESEQRLELAISGANLGIWDWNLKTGETTFNEQWGKMLGFELEEISQNVDTFTNNIHPEDRLLLTQAIQNHVIGKTLYFEVEFRMKTKSGEWKWIYDRGKVMSWDENGLPLRALGTHMDITERKQAENEVANKIEEVNEKNQELQQYIDSNMQLENFAYIASHDLKEPLRTVGNFAELLKKRYADVLDQSGQEYLDFIVGGAKNMNHLIEDLLTYSRVTNQEHTLEEINLPDLLALIKHGISNFIEEKQATIQYEGIPSMLIANRTKLKQLFQNLIVNGIKFHKKETKPEIKIIAKEKEELWQFEIRDNGIGIDPDYHEKIFLLFKKLHGKKEYQGTGIGLALCKKIVEQHSGNIWVESTPGEGTSFFFTLKKEKFVNGTNHSTVS